MNKRILFSFLTIVVLNGALISQGTFVNRVYQNESGSPLFNPILNPFGIQWSNSIISSTGDLYTIGYTTVSGQGQNIFLSKFDDVGNILFQVNYNTSSSNNDYGINLLEASNGDILVCGTTDNGGSIDYDIVILRYSSTGTLLNSSIQDGPANKNDVAVAITEDGSGNIIVAANTEASNNLSDYWVLMFDGVLNLLNSAIYDYTGLSDITLGLEFSTSGDICLIGASASGTAACDYAIAKFDGSTLSYISDTRNNIPGTAFDQALAFTKDASNNMYVTGKAWNGTNFDLKTIKIAANLTIAWTTTLDVHGFDDAANTIAIDTQSGDVIIGGYSTKTNSAKEIICIRYNAANGSLITAHNQSSEDASADAFIKKIVTNSNGEVYFVGGEKSMNGYKQTIIAKIKSNGDLSWKRTVAVANRDILPSDIKVSGADTYIISVKDSTIDSYLTAKYSELELDTAKGTYGPGLFKKNELIVRFLPSALDSTKIDDASEYGDLNYYLKTTAYNTVTTALENVCRDCDIKAIKIFPGHPTTFTSTTSRLGETIAVPDFWTALLLVFPQNTNIHVVGEVFNSLHSVAAYAHPNWMAQLYSAPDDSLYNQQLSLHTSTTYPGCDINIEEAWGIVKSGGNSYVRCTVVDVGLDWENVDFGYNGTNPATSKIAGGWDHRYPAASFMPLKSIPHGDAGGNLHATAIAGIIGAQRNNNRGIAGIAGGNDSTGSKGISIYGATVFDANGGPIFSLTQTPLNYIANAVYRAALPPNQIPWLAPYINYQCFKTNIENLSWGLYIPPYDTGSYANWVESTHLFHEVMYEINRLKVTAVAARGNDKESKINYPSCSDDDWVITVTGTGVNGQFAHDTTLIAGPINAEYTSNWGGPVDIGAPSSGSIITTLSTPNTFSLGSVYNSFGGTSAAAPHVTGVVGLMMSHVNYPDTVANYINMAPEDCEAILQMSAIDTDSTGYDILTGYGRLNAGKALRLLEKPYHALRHFGTNSLSAFTISKTLVSSVDTIYTTERFQKRTAPSNVWYPQGKYILKTYRVTSIVTHNLSNQDTIIGYWPRHSSSVTFPQIGNKKLMPRIKTKIVSLNNTSATLEGYIYQVKDSLGNPLAGAAGWWPVDTGYVNSPLVGNWAEYTILTRNYANIFTKVKEEKIENLITLKIFPNPGRDIENLLIETDKICELNVELYDLMGRKVKTVYHGKSESSMTSLSHSIADLPNSVYIYHIQIDGSTVCRKLIKQ